MKMLLRLFKKQDRYLENPFCRFKIYRIAHGGKWAYIDQHWLQADANGYIIDAIGRRYGCHYNYNGVSHREDWSMVFRQVYDYILNDWKSHPVRLILECLNWLGNATVGVICAFTAPAPPMIIIYPIWFFCIFISIFSAVSRGSVGMLVAALSVMMIDIVGYARLLLS